MSKSYRRKLDLKNGRVDLSHGAGGRAMAQLIEDIFHHAFDNDWLRAGNDQSAFDVSAGRMVMTTDGYVVSPLFFPGGDIGSLAVHGTINDIAMAGAKPLYLSASFIIEEGFPLGDLDRIARSMGEASRAAGVPVITGDTKVVERGKADGVFISTAGVGVVPPGLNFASNAARPGDVVAISGSIGDHGVAVMSKRENLDFETEILSDSAALHGLVAEMVAAGGPGIRVLRDPTRGGLAATLNELANQSDIGFQIDEDSILVKPQVAAACEFLGLDPMWLLITLGQGFDQMPLGIVPARAQRQCELNVVVRCLRELIGFNLSQVAPNQVVERSTPVGDAPMRHDTVGVVSECPLEAFHPLFVIEAEAPQQPQVEPALRLGGRGADGARMGSQVKRIGVIE